MSRNLKTKSSVEENFQKAQKAFKTWSELPPAERTAQSIIRALDLDFFELLDSVTIARSGKHIELFYDTADIGQFPKRKKPISHHLPITFREDVVGFDEIYGDLSLLKMAVYAPVNYIQPSRLKKYEELYDTRIEGSKGTLRQADRERSLQALMTTNLIWEFFCQPRFSVHVFPSPVSSPKCNTQP